MNLKLRILQCEDITQGYVDWFANEKMTRFSDNQYRTFSYETQTLYVKDCLENTDLDIYGIFDGSSHIGNVAISGLNSPHNRAEISYLIGEERYWRRGVGTFAVSAIVELSKSKYQLNKLYAGLAAKNLASKIVLERNGFRLEGKRKKHLFYNGEYHDQLDYGLLL